MKISNEGLELIKSFESLSLSAYQDDGGVWTIGYGHTTNVHEGDEIDEAHADYYLKRDLEGAERCVNACVKGNITQGQYDALVSFVFNLGCGALRRSTLLKHLNDGMDALAGAEFLKWDHDNGKQVAGLTRRRKAEQEMFLA